MASAPASEYTAQARGAGARRLAIWVCLVGLPLAYELSGILRGPERFYGGDRAYWYAGFDVRLVLLAVGVAVVVYALWRSRMGLSAVGWPARVPIPVWIGAVLLVGVGVLLAMHHPASVSSSVLPVSASTPVDPLERACLLILAVTEAIGQETIWRGALIRWLEPSVGTVGAVLLSGASYIFYHPGFGVQVKTLAVTIPVTAVYSALFLWRRNLLPSTFLHFVITVGQLTIPI